MGHMQKILLWIWNNISNIDSLTALIKFLVRIAVIFIGMITGFVRLKLRCNRYKFLNIPIDRATRQSMKYYIPTRGQLTDPSAGKEYTKNDSFNLTDLFLEHIFPKSDEQYFIILADSGMGKTTFLLNLFLKYYKKIRWKYDIVLIPLSFENAMEMINKIENKPSTILLLDGLDEDRHAMDDYIRRRKEICDATELFYKVVITCRTQFFPDGKSEPRKTDKIRYGTGKKSNDFKKYYLSPFCEKEIDRYLKKKYKGLSAGRKIEKSKMIINNCPDLMIRPMLLGYIDDLLEDSTKQYSTAYEIYSALVSKWIEREAVDHDILYEFSNKIAGQMYADRTIYISPADIEKLCKKYGINLKPIEARSKSLLNRNVNGDYKFAHKSILEFFIANQIYENWSPENPVPWDEVRQHEMVKRFLKEKCLPFWINLQETPHLNVSFHLFVSCAMHGTGFSNRRISDCEFIDCDFSGSDFTGTVFSSVRFVNADFSRANLAGIDLNNYDLSGARFEHACLKNAKLRGSNLNGADLSYADLTGADLEGANFESVNLKYTDFSNANLKGIRLKNSDLNFANLEGTGVTSFFFCISHGARKVWNIPFSDGDGLVLMNATDDRRYRHKE